MGVHANKQVNHLLDIGKSFVFILFLIFIDQFTKQMAYRYLRPVKSVSIISHIFELFYLENHGAAFGILQGGRWLFIPLTILAVAFLSWFYLKLMKNGNYKGIQLLILFFISGSIGNFIDRILNGYVIDFFYFSIINFPVFNVADIYVSCSCILFFILILFKYHDKDWKDFIADKNENGVR